MTQSSPERRPTRVRRPAPNRSDNPIKSTPATSKRPSRMVTVTEEDLRTEYAYVLKDLRLLFVIAIALFVLLFVLNLTFPYFSHLLPF
jgi:hypothetical protein